MAAYWVLGGNSAPEGAELYRQLLEDTQDDYWLKEKLDLFESTNQNHENRWKQVNSEFKSWWELLPFYPESIFLHVHSFSFLFIHESHAVSTFEILQLAGWLWDHPCPSMVWSHVAFVSCRQWVLKNASIGVSLRLGANSKTHSCCEIEWIYPVTKALPSGHPLLFYL